MSYCRWSCLNGRSDAYVYKSEHGFEIHLRKVRPPEGAPEKGLKIFLDRGLEAYNKATEIYDEWAKENPSVKIDHPEAGETFTHETAGECALELERLVGEGFVIPSYAIESLREEEEGMSKKNHYRFENGIFVEAADFDEAKRVLIEKIQTEVEDPDSWHSCTCLGFSHRFDCPEYVIPY